MPSLADHKSNKLVKLLLLGNSGTGKTGALVSLAQAGYKLRILDYDNGLDILARVLKSNSPDKLKNVDYISLRDKVKAAATGPILDGQPKAFINGMKMLENWDPASIGMEGAALGKPYEWGEESVLVIDTLTFLSDAAMNQARAMNPSVKDPRQWFFEAQKAVLQVLGLVTSEHFNTNVIVIAHIAYQDMPDGTKKGYPTSIGSAIGPAIPAYFNSVALAESTGSPPKRTIKTASTLMIDLKSPAAFKMQAAMPLETALADYFKLSKE
jgi:hypothetical protein